MDITQITNILWPEDTPEAVLRRHVARLLMQAGPKPTNVQLLQSQLERLNPQELAQVEPLEGCRMRRLVAGGEPYLVWHGAPEGSTHHAVSLDPSQVMMAEMMMGDDVPPPEPEPEVQEGPKEKGAGKRRMQRAGDDVQRFKLTARPGFDAAPPAAVKVLEWITSSEPQDPIFTAKWASPSKQPAPLLGMELGSRGQPAKPNTIWSGPPQKNHDTASPYRKRLPVTSTTVDNTNDSWLSEHSGGHTSFPHSSVAGSDTPRAKSRATAGPSPVKAQQPRSHSRLVDYYSAKTAEVGSAPPARWWKQNDRLQAMAQHIHGTSPFVKTGIWDSNKLPAAPPSQSPPPLWSSPPPPPPSPPPSSPPPKAAIPSPQPPSRMPPQPTMFLQLHAAIPHATPTTASHQPRVLEEQPPHPPAATHSKAAVPPDVDRGGAGGSDAGSWERAADIQHYMEEDEVCCNMDEVDEQDEEQLTEVFGVRLLALAAYRPAVTAVTAGAQGNNGSAPYHVTQLRCVAACLLAGVVSGPAGPGSGDAQGLGARLQQADPGAWWALCAGGAARVGPGAGCAASAEDAALMALADGCALQAVLMAQGRTALRLDVPQLEQAAMAAAKAAVPKRKVPAPPAARAERGADPSEDGDNITGITDDAAGGVGGLSTPSTNPATPAQSTAPASGACSSQPPAAPSYSAEPPRKAHDEQATRPDGFESSASSNTQFSRLAQQKAQRLEAAGASSAVQGAPAREAAQQGETSGSTPRPVPAVAEVDAAVLHAAAAVVYAGQSAQQQLRRVAAQALAAALPADCPAGPYSLSGNSIISAYLKEARQAWHAESKPGVSKLKAVFQHSDGILTLIVPDKGPSILRLDAAALMKAAGMMGGQAEAAGYAASQLLQAAVNIVYQGQDDVQVLRRVAACAIAAGAVAQTDGRWQVHDLQAPQLGVLATQQAPMAWERMRKPHARSALKITDNILRHVPGVGGNNALRMDVAALLRSAATAITTAGSAVGQSKVAACLNAAAAVVFGGDDGRAVLRRAAVQYAVSSCPMTWEALMVIPGASLGGYLSQQLPHAWAGLSSMQGFKLHALARVPVLVLVPSPAGSCALALDARALLSAAMRGVSSPGPPDQQGQQQRRSHQQSGVEAGVASLDTSAAAAAADEAARFVARKTAGRIAASISSELPRHLKQPGPTHPPIAMTHLPTGVQAATSSARSTSAPPDDSSSCSTLPASSPPSSVTQLLQAAANIVYQGQDDVQVLRRVAARAIAAHVVVKSKRQWNVPMLTGPRLGVHMRREAALAWERMPLPRMQSAFGAEDGILHLQPGAPASLGVCLDVGALLAAAATAISRHSQDLDTASMECLNAAAAVVFDGDDEIQGLRRAAVDFAAASLEHVGAFRVLLFPKLASEASVILPEEWAGLGNLQGPGVEALGCEPVLVAASCGNDTYSIDLDVHALFAAAAPSR